MQRHALACLIYFLSYYVWWYFHNFHWKCYQSQSCTMTIFPLLFYHAPVGNVMQLWEHTSCAWLSESTQTFPLTNVAEQLLWLNIKSVANRISTARNVFKCSILASIFSKNFLGKHAPSPPSSSMFCMLDVHLHPRKQCLQLATPSTNPIDLPLYW